MRKAYRTLDEVMENFPLWEVKAHKEKTDRVFRATKLEDSIYSDLHMKDEDFQRLEAEAAQKLPSFSALSRDVFQMFYSLMPRKNNAEVLTASAQKLNARILEKVQQQEGFPSMKAVCEGKALPAYEAASEFSTQIAGELDTLLEELGGKPGMADTLERLRNAEDAAKEKLRGLLEKIQRSETLDDSLVQGAVNAANQVDSRMRQAQAVSRAMDSSAAQRRETIFAAIGAAMCAAQEKAEEAKDVLMSWGDGSGNMEQSETNMELLRLVRQSETLRQVSRYLGRFREVLAQQRRNGYAYGRGEKYTLELGNDLSKALTSELAMLAAPETAPLFLRKYQEKRLKQYRRREPIQKGMGDIICCLDESSSTRGDAAAWGKAVALTLLDIAASSGRRFALIHFSGKGHFQTDLFLQGKYAPADRMNAAEVFLSGGTDFVTPMEEAIRLMREDDFDTADIVFLTDGLCALPDSYLEKLREDQRQLRFSITGILLDTGDPAMTFSLAPFCQTIYRTSQLLGDEIVREVIGQLT